MCYLKDIAALTQFCTPSQSCDERWPTFVTDADGSVAKKQRNTEGLRSPAFVQSRKT